MQFITCSECSQSNPENSLYCSNCGAPLNTTVPKPEKYTGYYARVFNEFDNVGGEFKPTWNWWSLLFGPFWYLYKGIWLKGVILLVLPFTGFLAPFCWIYSGVCGNYDLYLLQVKNKQFW
ncbi:DUF2628 domain-containing protein [Thalassoporum mexicanum]|uniref:DUF2628 domain-containing protein n=1 Tax=Thalassoporum mexicanum TaxID=3457544 RepID=UPI0009005700